MIETGKPPLFPLPAGLAEITAEWLQEALRLSFPDLLLPENVTASRVGEGYGLASEIYRLSWDAGSPPHAAIVKLWSTYSPAGRREVDFYAALAGPLQSWIPACFFGAVDPEWERGALILENLSPATQGDCLLQLPLSAARAAAQRLAGIHAAWLNRPELRDAEWLPNTAVWERRADWFNPRRERFLSRFMGRLSPGARAQLDRIEHAPQVANARLAGAPLALLHGDLHLDNYVFVHGTEPVLLDWANCTQGPPALDLYDLLFSISAAPDRDRVMEEYRAAFQEFSGLILDPDETWRQLGGAFLRKFAAATCGVANWNPASPREAAMIEVGLERIVAATAFWQARDPALFSFL